MKTCKAFKGQKRGDKHHEHLRDMYLSRYLDQKMFRLSRQNKGAALQLSAEGHELIGVLTAHSLQSGKDWAFPYYRDQPFGVALGCSLKELIGAFLCRGIDHHSKGRMMPAHFSHKKLHMPPQSSVVGSQYLQAVGLAKALQISGVEDEVVYVSGGDGSTSQGDFSEALNFSSIHKLPMLFVVQDNGWAISVPNKEQTSGGSVAKTFSGYANVKVFEVDGCDYEDVSSSLKKALTYIRSGKGSVLLVAKVPRMAPHSNSDNDKKYKSDTDFAADKKRDPIPLYEKFLLDSKIATKTELKQLQETCFAEVEAASEEAEKIAFPTAESATEHVFKEVADESYTCSSDKHGEEEVIVDSLNHALVEEMERDKRVVVFGQDVAHGKGGVFGVTRDLTKKFGSSRCFNTPLAESTIVGITTGLSLSGLVVPVAEVQFADYLWPGINQLINELSSLHYRSGGEWNCPCVIRMPTGGYIQGGPYHSQNIEGFLAHAPGLKIVYPSNAHDAKALLKAAIRDPNPVVFLEHKALYRQRKFSARKEPSKDCLLPLGKASVVREGEDLTVVTWGMMTAFVKELADKFARDGKGNVEVVDLRTISPWDKETVLASVRKTSRLLVVHEACLTGGFGGEIAAVIAEEAFEDLDAPVKRHAAKDVPIPYAKVLEDAVLPSAESIASAMLEMLAY
jgi:2-oxoisovalerate dehydrogenase E1 component